MRKFILILLVLFSVGCKSKHQLFNECFDRAMDQYKKTYSLFVPGLDNSLLDADVRKCEVMVEKEGLY